MKRTILPIGILKNLNAAGGKLWHTLYYSEEIVVRNSYLISD